ncbi:MAG: tetratricopeptide repeat protein, partial [Conexivisphaera sp.]
MVLRIKSELKNLEKEKAYIILVTPGCLRHSIASALRKELGLERAYSYRDVEGFERLPDIDALDEGELGRSLDGIKGSAVIVPASTMEGIFYYAQLKRRRAGDVRFVKLPEHVEQSLGELGQPVEGARVPGRVYYWHLKGLSRVKSEVAFSGVNPSLMRGEVDEDAVDGIRGLALEADEDGSLRTKLFEDVPILLGGAFLYSLIMTTMNPSGLPILTPLAALFAAESTATFGRNVAEKFWEHVKGKDGRRNFVGALAELARRAKKVEEYLRDERYEGVVDEVATKYGLTLGSFRNFILNLVAFAGRGSSDEAERRIVQGLQVVVDELRKKVDELQASLGLEEAEVRDLRRQLDELIPQVRLLSNPGQELSPEELRRELHVDADVDPIYSSALLDKARRIEEYLAEGRKVVLSGEAMVGKTTLLYRVLRDLMASGRRIYVNGLRDVPSDGIYVHYSQYLGAGELDVVSQFQGAVLIEARTDVWNGVARPGFAQVEVTRDDYTGEQLREILRARLRAGGIGHDEDGIEEAVRRSGGLAGYLDALVVYLRGRGITRLDRRTAEAVPEKVLDLIADTVLELSRRGEGPLSLLYCLSLTSGGRLHGVQLRALAGKMGADARGVDDYLLRQHDVYYLRHELWSEVLRREWRELGISKNEPGALRDARMYEGKCRDALRGAFEDALQQLVQLSKVGPLTASVITLENYPEMAEKLLRLSLGAPGGIGCYMREAIGLKVPGFVDQYARGSGGEKAVRELWDKVGSDVRCSPRFALQLLEWLRVYYEERGDNEEILAGIYNNLGVAYDDVHEFQRAIEYFQRAISIYEPLSRDNPAYLPDLATSYNNLGIAYRNAHEFQRAIEYFQRAISIYEPLSRDNPAYLPDLAASYNNLGVAYRNA